MRRLFLSTFAVALGACGSPDLRDEDAPAPAAVFEGTLTYIGPQPSCDEGGTPRGRVAFTLFAADNPPPPEGSAASALSLLTLPGDDLFTAGDCRPDGQQPAVVVRSAPFVWPDIPLGPGDAGIDYQVRAFYDDGGDFVPFFGVRNLPTQGDVIGGALVPPAGPALARIAVPAAASAPDGVHLSGVTVTLGAYVYTERPLFRLQAGWQPMASSALFPLVAPGDVVGLTTGLHALAGISMELIPAGAAAYGDALAAAGVPFDLSSPGYAWFVRPVDADANGEPDPHPVLGSAGLPWQYPIVIYERARTEAELAAGIPGVLFFATVDPVEIAGRSVVAPRLRVLVPPIAVLDLAPPSRACRIPVVPPGNIDALRPAGSDCQELPTGRYGMSVLGGLAGGELRAEPNTAVSATGYDVAGGRYSGQAWRIPNELGPADTHYRSTALPQLEESLLIAEQGPAARFAVVETTPGDGVRTACPLAAPVPLPASCCAPIAHLCGLPLCEPAADADGFAVRELVDPAAACVPFPMPAGCCPE